MMTSSNWYIFLRYWSFMRGIHRSPVNSPHKGQWLGALIFSLISVWINGSVNNGEAGNLRRYRVHYDVSVIPTWYTGLSTNIRRKCTPQIYNYLIWQNKYFRYGSNIRLVFPNKQYELWNPFSHQSQSIWYFRNQWTSHPFFWVNVASAIILNRNNFFVWIAKHIDLSNVRCLSSNLIATWRQRVNLGTQYLY